MSTSAAIETGIDGSRSVLGPAAVLGPELFQANYMDEMLFPIFASLFAGERCQHESDAEGYCGRGW